MKLKCYMAYPEGAEAGLNSLVETNDPLLKFGMAQAHRIFLEIDREPGRIHAIGKLDGSRVFVDRLDDHVRIKILVRKIVRREPGSALKAARFAHDRPES